MPTYPFEERQPIARRVRRIVRTSSQFPPVLCHILFTLLAGATISAQARDYFDPALLTFGTGAGQPVDLSQFENVGGQAEGDYNVDVYINNQFAGTKHIRFSHNKVGELQPVITPASLDSWGVNLKSQRILAALPIQNALPEPLSYYIQQSRTQLDFSLMRLDISVPQLYMKTGQDTLADPALWQGGEPAFLLNYNLSGNTYESRNDTHSTSQAIFGSFQSGVNWGPWRLRNSSTYSYNQQRFDRYDILSNAKQRGTRSQSQWSSLQTFLQRDINVLRSQLTLGETSTGSVASQVLEGFLYRGVGLMSSDAMIPGSLSGFAPVITGTARTNALVTVTQNGYVIYQANVAAGPFRFADISGSGTGGDLQVTIKETDGTTHGFRQPYSSLPVMQRQGQLRYELAAGQYYIGHGAYTGSDTPGFVMLSAIYGLPWSLTLYGGGVGAGNYQSAAIGAGFSILDYGAVSVDATHSRANFPGDNQTLSGESFRARYSKSMMSTGTTVDLTGYRYSTRNYLSFNDANNRGYGISNGLPDWLNGRRRSSYEMRLSQTLWNDYQLWFSGHRDNYWGSDKTNTTLSTGLSGSIHQVGWAVNYSVDRMRGNGDWPENRQWTLTLSVPMSLFSSAATFKSSYANYSLTHDNTGRSSNQLSVGGALLADSRVSWNVSQSQGNQGRGNSGSASLGYSDSTGSANLGYNYASGGGRGVTYSANGGLIAHRRGVTLSRNIGDAAAVIHTGVPGVKIMNGDVMTDYWGNAVVTSMQTYARNNIDIDPSSLPEGASPPSGSRAIYPTAGAILVEDYQVRLGQQVLMNLSHKGKPVPFGAVVALEGETGQASIVGEGGQVYLGGMPEKGTLQVKWSTAADAQCKVFFTLPKPMVRSTKDTSWHPIKTFDMLCR